MRLTCRAYRGVPSSSLDAVDYVMLRWPRINHVAWPIRLGNFLLRRDQSRRALPINPAAAVTAATGSRDDEGAGQ